MERGSWVLSLAGAMLFCTSAVFGADRLVPSVYPTIQAGIDAAEPGDTVIIAEGTYTGDGNHDLDFGGKAITVRSTEPNDWDVVAATVVDGQYAGRGFYFHSAETASSVLAGLTITNGYADFGGGIFCTGSSPTIRNCKLTDNIADYGGGMGNQNCSPTVTECMFVGNSVYGCGGGMSNSGCTLAVSNCIFAGNSALMGGGMENIDCSGSIVNCTFSGNSADLGGGIDSCGTLNPNVSNCILWGDSAFIGPEICGDCSVSYSDVQGGYAGAGNINADPCFANPTGGDYHLQSQAGRWDPNQETWVRDANTSVCIDAGDMSSTVGSEPFPNGGMINVGAYGGTSEASKSYWGSSIVPGDLNGDGNVDFIDFAILAHGWLDYYDWDALAEMAGNWLRKSFFTIAILPDTQLYSKYFPEIFISQTQWIVEHKDELRIEFVLHEGDITNNNNTDQWENAKASLSLLDGNVPYALVPGNHDMGTNGQADTRDTTLLNTYFPLSSFEDSSTFGGVYEPNKLDNSYHLFSAGGTDWLILALEFGPRDPVLDWANQVVADFPNRRVIVLTHAYMYSDDTLLSTLPTHKGSPHIYGVANEPGGVNDGVEMWDKFVCLHPNISFVFSGHGCNDGTGRLVGIGDNGNKVYQMLANFQMLDNGGNGYLRLVEFQANEQKVSVTTYSPYLDQYLTDTENQFEFTDVELGLPIP